MSDLTLKPARRWAAARVTARVDHFPLAAPLANHELLVIAAFSVAGLLVALNLILRFPDLGAMLF